MDLTGNIGANLQSNRSCNGAFAKEGLCSQPHHATSVNFSNPGQPLTVGPCTSILLPPLLLSDSTPGNLSYESRGTAGTSTEHRPPFVPVI